MSISVAGRTRVLVVDDDPAILHALRVILQSEGYDVIAHTDPHRAKDERDFAVVLTDYTMPGLNGVELLDACRVHSPEAVRLMLTAAPDFKTAASAVNRGEVFRLLAKPWNLAELTACVRQAVEHWALRRENARLEREVSGKNAELTQINHALERLVLERTNGLLDGLISALDYRDTETQWHSRRVALYARRIAEAVGVTGHALDVIAQAALLHGVGKIGVRDGTLLKPGPLSADEWLEVRRHPEFGFRILQRIPFLQEAAVIVLQQRERYDGRGYPAGLQRDEIVLGARIVAVADAFDAMTSDRAYRRAGSLAAAQLEISRCSGTQFDPVIADAFLAVSDAEWPQLRAAVEAMQASDQDRFGEHSRPFMQQREVPVGDRDDATASPAS